MSGIAVALVGRHDDHIVSDIAFKGAVTDPSGFPTSPRARISQSQEQRPSEGGAPVPHVLDLRRRDNRRDDEHPPAGDMVAAVLTEPMTLANIVAAIKEDTGQKVSEDSVRSALTREPRRFALDKSGKRPYLWSPR